MSESWPVVYQKAVQRDKMNVLYHLPILPPKIPAGEALSQEIQALRNGNGGDLVYVNPNQNSVIYIPRLLFGLSMLKALRDREKNFDLHHFYNPDPFPYPYLLGLRRPVIYTISSGISARHIHLRYFNRLAAVAVYDERSQQRLVQAGLRNVHLIRPGIDISRFTCTPLPLGRELRLLVASAPWTRAQFRTKGIDALLKAAQQDPHLHFIFLWRGILIEEMERRIHGLDLESQITLINSFVNVNQILAGVHATITLATNAALIKAYPHSLLDSLAAGKPVLVNRAIPMADYVEQKCCGVVLDKVAAESILEAIVTLSENYAKLTTEAAAVGQRDFAQANLLQVYEQIYQHTRRTLV
ncbi:MAG: glycosyltransferase [Anaerolineae bacterium]|nr:glycosyltransferase [Anaerolineae bacterium]